MRRVTAPLLWALTTLALLVARDARAVPLRGTIKLPTGYGEAHPLKRAGYWLLPNDVLEILPPLTDVRTEMVVTLAGAGIIGETLVRPVVRLEDSRFQPAVLPVAPHSRVTFENKEPVAHQVEPLGQPFMKPQQLKPKGSFAQVFDTPGSYQICSRGLPHMRATIFVTGDPLFVQPDPGGVFVFPEIRPGTYTLKVWYRDKWIHSQPVTVGAKNVVDVQLRDLPKKD